MLAMLCMVGLPLPQDWYVDANAPSCPGGTGTASDPFCRIADAVAAATDGDTILIAPGTYVENLVLDEDLTLIGTAGSAATILDGGMAGSVVRATDAVVVELIGLTLTNGTGTTGSDHNGSTVLRGGGLFLDGPTSVTLTACSVTGNSADYGGGIDVLRGNPLVDGPTLELWDSKVSGNSAGVGGGMAIAPADCSVWVIRTTVSGNTAYQGGGTFQNCGFMWCGSSYLLIYWSAVTANSATAEGGGIFSTQWVEVVNSLVSDNTASLGGLYFWPGYGYLDLRNSTVTRNSGGGLYAPDYGEIWNSILWDNPSGSVLTPPTPNFSVDRSLVQGGWSGAGANNLDADPLFADPSKGNYRLLPGSPCIDAGDNTAASGLRTDLRGVPRFIDDPLTLDSGVGPAPVVDMGAFEFFRRFR